MIYHWFSWLAIVAVAFLSNYTKISKKLILFGLLCNIIFINFYIEIGSFTFSLPFLYCFIIFCLITIFKPMYYFNYYLFFCLVMIYIGCRYIFITAPIWMLVNEFFIIILIFIAALLIFIKSNHQRISVLITSFLMGEWLFVYNVQRLNWHVIIGESDLFISLYIGIALLYMSNWLISRYKMY